MEVIIIILLTQKFKICTEGNDALDFYSRSSEFESQL